jgi:hypothetical protein
MALTDHITDSAALKEEEIESIIADFLKYDPTHKAVVFLPKTHSLSVEKKILLHLVALRGWQFVVKENPPSANAAPRDIERVTGVRGGTLRPMLRALVQSMMLEAKKGKYEIPAHNLGRVREAMAGSGTTVTSRPVTERQRKASGDQSAIIKKASQSKPSLSEAFEKLLQTGWFKEGRTLGQLREKLGQMAVIVPDSHLPVYLLKACRGDRPRLVRNREVMGGKRLWVYSHVA